MSLGSNLYLSGLAAIDYMQMKEKLVPFTRSTDAATSLSSLGTTKHEDQITIES